MILNGKWAAFTLLFARLIDHSKRLTVRFTITHSHSTSVLTFPKRNLLQQPTKIPHISLSLSDIVHITGTASNGQKQHCPAIIKFYFCVSNLKLYFRVSSLINIYSSAHLTSCIVITHCASS